MGVLSGDFAAVDFREELCYHALPEKADPRATVTACLDQGEQCSLTGEFQSPVKEDSIP